MPRRSFQTTASFAAGTVAEEFHFRPDIESVQQGAKSGSNIMLNKAGGVVSRGVLNNIQPAWFDFEDNTRAIPFKGQDAPYGVVYRVDRAVLLTQVTIDIVNLSTGVLVANFQDGWLSGADVDEKPHYVQFENTLLISSRGARVVQIIHNGGGSFTFSDVQWYEESSGVAIQLIENGFNVVSVAGQEVDDNGDIITQSATGLSRWTEEYVDGDTIRIAGQNFTVDTVISDFELTIVEQWTGPSVVLPYPPARVREQAFTPRGIALFQTRLVMVADGADLPENARGLSVNMSALYDPFIISPAVQILGQRDNAPIDFDLRLGRDTELMWVVGGDTLTIGGNEQEYTLSNPRVPITPTNLPAFRVTSNYGSTTQAAVQPHDGNIIFGPKSGGAIVSMEFTETQERFVSGELAPLAPQLFPEIRAIELFERTFIDPVDRVLTVTNGGWNIGTFTDLLDVPGWFAQTLPANITARDIIEIDNEVYMYVWRSFGSNQATFLKWQFDSPYTLDLQTVATPQGGTPTANYTVADEYLQNGEAFAITTREFVRYNVTGDTNDISFNQLLTATSGGSGRVHKIGIDYVELRTPTGTISNGATFIGTGLTINTQEARTETRADEPVTISAGAFSLTVPANSVVVGKPFVAELEPLNIESGDELGTTHNRKRRVLSARVRYSNTKQFYVSGRAAVGDMQAPLEKEIPDRSGVFRHTFLGGWRTEDSFTIKSMVPYRLTIDDLTREVAA